MSDYSSIKPQMPFLVMNDRFICRFTGGKEWSESITGKAFAAQAFLENTVIVDVNCRKFTVVGAQRLGWCLHLYNLFGLANLFCRIEKRKYRFIYNTDKFKQLTFTQARDEIVEHICSHRWVGQAGGTKDHFRKLQSTKKTMSELVEGISFFGKWPFD